MLSDNTQPKPECATMSVEDAAAILGISRGWAYQLCREGTLPGVIKLGTRRYVVSRKALKKALEGSD